MKNLNNTGLFNGLILLNTLELILRKLDAWFENETIDNANYIGIIKRKIKNGKLTLDKISTKVKEYNTNNLKGSEP